MPGYLLDAGAVVSCAHGGQAYAMPPSARVRVGAQPITTATSQHIVIGCPFTVSGTAVPCVVLHWTDAATRVRSLGVPLLLEDSQAFCLPNGTPATVTNTQVRVQGK